ncbi:hypothetical protein [Piscibacillus halophilus]|uniref:Uncharacterized protein n=1 Tax=Piscibacillus halophilus TaxID=571933 RepID=A0A1H9F6S6_9BACI|nr:hypothetical protein [Piscibacillus halophilus]SEQ33674.1 hypothetical protein SAMN05216362_11150 [Piscibacillus halophilus]
MDQNKKHLKNKDTVDNKRKSVNEERRNELHKYKDEQLVDDIPLKDLEIEEKNTKKKTNSQSTSQSEQKYNK